MLELFQRVHANFGACPSFPSLTKQPDLGLAVAGSVRRWRFGDRIKAVSAGVARSDQRWDTTRDVLDGARKCQSLDDALLRRLFPASRPGPVRDRRAPSV